MEKSLNELEKLIDDTKKYGEKNVTDSLEVFRSTTIQKIKKTKDKLDNIRKNDN